MHDTWHILRWAWSAVVIVYCVLAIVADRRLRSAAKKRSRNILIAMVVLVAIREAVWRFFGGLVYRLVVIMVGIAAGIAAAILAKMLISQPRGDEDETVGNSDRIQSLKLN